MTNAAERTLVEDYLEELEEGAGLNRDFANEHAIAVLERATTR